MKARNLVSMAAMLALGLTWGVGAAVAADEPIVKLLDGGSGAKEALRYKFSMKPSTAVMDMKMSMSMEMAGGKQPEMKLPTIRMNAALKPTAIDPQGNLKYDFGFNQVKVLDDETAAAQLVATLQTELKQVEGMHGFAVVDPRGNMTEGDVQSDSTDPKLAKMVSEFKSQLRQMAVPFPVEPVGKGAKWTVTTQVNSNGVSVTQVATYTLADRSGDHLKLSVAIAQDAPAQELKSADLPPGAKTMLKNMKASGAAQVEVDLNRLVPNSKGNVDLVMEMEIEMSGQKMPMKMGMGIVMSISEQTT
jgi:hypothetical protein